MDIVARVVLLFMALMRYDSWWRRIRRGCEASGTPDVETPLLSPRRVKKSVSSPDVMGGASQAASGLGASPSLGSSVAPSTASPPSHKSQKE